MPSIHQRTTTNKHSPSEKVLYMNKTEIPTMSNAGSLSLAYNNSTITPVTTMPIADGGSPPNVSPSRVFVVAPVKPDVPSHSMGLQPGLPLEHAETFALPPYSGRPPTRDLYVLGWVVTS